MRLLNIVLLLVFALSLGANALLRFHDSPDRPPNPWLSLISDLGIAALVLALWFPMSAELFNQHLTNPAIAVFFASPGYIASALAIVVGIMRFRRTQDRDIRKLLIAVPAFLLAGFILFEASQYGTH